MIEPAQIEDVSKPVSDGAKVESPSAVDSSSSATAPSGVSSAGELKVLDSDASEAAPKALGDNGPKVVPYDGEEFHDKARKHIAFFLLFILAAVIATFLADLFIGFTNGTFEQRKSVLETLLTPLLTLVSAATGFYFGSKK